MKRMNPAICLILLISSPLLYAEVYVPAEAPGTVTVLGDSTLHAWHAEAELTQGSLTLQEGEISALNVTVEVETLQSGKKGLDKNMYKAMDTGSFPEVTFVVTAVEVPEELPEGMEGEVRKLTGDLTILKTTTSIEVFVTLQPEAEGKLTLSGSVDLDMTDYGVEPPKAMLGTIRTDPKVTVEFTWNLVKQAVQP